MHDQVEADLWSQLPVDVPALLALLPRTDLYLQDEMQVAFHPTREQPVVPQGAMWATHAAKHRGIIAESTALAWSTGVMGGPMAGSLQDGLLMRSASKCVLLWLVPEERGRVAIVIADKLKTHTSTGSLLVPNMLTELQEQLYLVYKPAMILTPTGSNGSGLLSRRAVTQNHHRSMFELLFADVEQHFQALTRTPAEVLRHIGSPFAPDTDHDAPLSLAEDPHNQLGSLEREEQEGQIPHAHVTQEDGTSHRKTRSM